MQRSDLFDPFGILGGAELGIETAFFGSAVVGGGEAVVALEDGAHVRCRRGRLLLILFLQWMVVVVVAGQYCFLTAWLLLLRGG